MRSASPSAAKRAPRVRTWYDLEPPPRTATWGLARRLVRRGRASWRIWGGIALALALAVAVHRARLPPVYRVTAVIRVVEGAVSSPGTDLGVSALGAYVNEVVFTNRRLIELMKRHPETYRDLDKNALYELEDLRKQIEVTISENYFVQERDPNDPPRSARIVLAFSAGDPQLTLAIVQELTDLIVGSAGERQREALTRERAAAADALAKAEAQLAAASGGDKPLDPSDSRLQGARARLAAADQQLVAAEIAMRAAEGQQALRFEVVDSGRLPTAAATPSSIVGFISTLVVALIGGALLAGAFDSRVLDPGDLEALGIVPLGRFPWPRGPREGPPARGDGEAGEGPPGDGPGGASAGKSEENGPGGTRELPPPRV